MRGTRTLRSPLLRLAAVALAAATLGTTGWASPASAHTPRNHRMAREHVKDRLFSQMGAPYRYGSESPRRGFDCSGLVYWAFTGHGDDDLPRSSSDMWGHRNQEGYKRMYTTEKLAVGDLLFFNTSGRGVSHVATYVGRNKMIHTGSSGGRVRTDDVDYGYYKQRFVGAIRVPALRKPGNR